RSPARARAGPSWVLVLHARLQGLLPLRLELLGRAEAEVSVALIDQLRRVFEVEGRALGLPVGAERTALIWLIWALIPVQSKPLEIGTQLIFITRFGTLDVRILDAQDEGAAVAPSKKPVKQRRARVPHVDVAGRAGGEPDSDFR